MIVKADIDQCRRDLEACLDVRLDFALVADESQ